VKGEGRVGGGEGERGRRRKKKSRRASLLPENPPNQIQHKTTHQKSQLPAPGPLKLCS
jgi:hypothetical protein